MIMYEVLINNSKGDPDEWKSTGEHLTALEASQRAQDHNHGFDQDGEGESITYTLFDKDGNDYIQFRSYAERN